MYGILILGKFNSPYGMKKRRGAFVEKFPSYIDYIHITTYFTIKEMLICTNPRNSIVLIGQKYMASPVFLT